MNLTHHKSHHRALSQAFVVVAIIATALLSGCGKSGIDRFQVNGKVTFGGAAPPADGTLTFLSIKPAEGFPARPGRANFSKGDGTFTATSIKPGDGLAPGTYSVEITCWHRRPTEQTPGISHVPADYKPPELTIKPNQAGPIEFNLEIPTGQ